VAAQIAAQLDEKKRRKRRRRKRRRRERVAIDPPAEGVKRVHTISMEENP
jgi:hypothetical protein